MQLLQYSVHVSTPTRRRILPSRLHSYHMEDPLSAVLCVPHFRLLPSSIPQTPTICLPAVLSILVPIPLVCSHKSTLSGRARAWAPQKPVSSPRGLRPRTFSLSLSHVKAWKRLSLLGSFLVSRFVPPPPPPSQHFPGFCGKISTSTHDHTDHPKIPLKRVCA